MKNNSDRHSREADLEHIMSAVIQLVDDMLPPDEKGERALTPEITHDMKAVQDAISKVLDLPTRPVSDF